MTLVCAPSQGSDRARAHRRRHAMADLSVRAPHIEQVIQVRPEEKLLTSAKVARLVALFAVGAIIWYAPIPKGIAVDAWHLFAIFVATIVGLILQPLPMGAIVLLGVLASALTGTLSIGDALNGFSNSTVWLIFVAYIFARAFAKTGLGRRVAYWFIRAFG